MLYIEVKNIRLKVLLGVILCSSIVACATQKPLEKEAIIRGSHKWLPQKESTTSLAQDVDEFLQTLDGSLRMLYCKYDEAQLVHSQALDLNTTIIDDNKWQTSINTRPVESDPSAMDINIQVQLKAGAVKESGVAVAFDFHQWSADNYVLLPAVVYNGNRVEIVDRGYAQGLDRKYLYQEDIPLMSVPIPHLSKESGAISRLEVNASNMATPAMCFYDREKERGFILLTEQKTQFADNGFFVEESEDRGIASFVITAPGVREKRPLFVGFTESTDKGASINSGDVIDLQMRIYSFEAKTIPEVLEKFMLVRKSVTGPNSPRNLIPFSQVAKYMTERIDGRWYEDERFQFYCPENADWISFGWIGGLMNTYPMIALGDTFHLSRVIKTFDFAIPRAQGEAGYYCGTLNYDGTYGFRESYPEYPEIVLTRKNADVLYWMIKQFDLLKAQGKSQIIDPEWETSMRKLADAFVGTWKKHGQWGRMVNHNTGEVAEYVSSGGVMAIGGLALASVYFENPEYMKIALEATDYYYQKEFVSQGMTTGGCADILHNADSESAAGFMTSLMTLYELTEDEKYLEKCQNLANLVATWTTSYDYELPLETELGSLGAKLAGIYWASTQNKHGAPGICTSSGDPLFKIYRHTGNLLYADLMNDIVHAHGESIRPGGYTNERLTYCDAESRGERGTHVTGWNELNGFLMALEIPGIYVQTDGELFYVFDHVEAEITERDIHGLSLKIKNPTEFDAEVSIFAETVKQAEKPMGYNAFVNWPSLGVKAGEILQLRISRDGKINLNL
jgi:hypothetical protein